MNTTTSQWSRVAVHGEFDTYERDRGDPGWFEMLTIDHGQRLAWWEVYNVEAWEDADPITCGAWDYEAALAAVKERP